MEEDTIDSQDGNIMVTSAQTGNCCDVGSSHDGNYCDVGNSQDGNYCDVCKERYLL